MGFSQTWLAVRGGTAETVLPQLGLRGTGKREEEAESPLVGAELAGDWYIVIANRGGDPKGMLKAAPRVSANNEVVFGMVEEHVMASEASHWRGGQQVWRVAHDSQHGLEHLEIAGTLPPQFETIKAGFAKQQLDEGPNANVDFFFSIPLELARSLTGYIHDEDMAGIGAEPYEVLEVAKHGTSEPSASRPWWKRLTGG
jgi:hypothetical protein